MATNHRVLWGAALVLALLAVLSFAYGTPAALYYSFASHEHSPAYDGRSFSKLDNNDHHLRVCDKGRNLVKASARVEFKHGHSISVTDHNGADHGCGNTNFTRNGQRHITCAGATPSGLPTCGGYSSHPGLILPSSLVGLL